MGSPGFLKYPPKHVKADYHQVNESKEDVKEQQHILTIYL
jgi:hypothetical protein